MKLNKLLVVMPLLMLLTMSCIKRIPKEDRAKKTAPIKEVDIPKVIKDTISENYVVEEVIVEDDIVAQDVEETQPDPMPTTVTNRGSVTSKPTRTREITKHRQEDGGYDSRNTGFFERYQQSYTGDPNRNLQPKRRTISPSNEEEVEKERQALEKSLELLEKEYQLEQEKYKKQRRDQLILQHQRIEEEEKN